MIFRSTNRKTGGTMKRIFILAIIAVALIGCISTQQQREIRDEQIQDAENLALAGKRICVDKRHAGIFKTYAESAECSNLLIIAAYERVKFPYMDLVREYTDKRLEILKELDDKQITSERSDKKMNECLAYLTAEAHVRDLEK